MKAGTKAEPKRVLLMVTSSDSLILIDGLVKKLVALGFEVHASASPNITPSHLAEAAVIHQLRMRRAVSPRHDLVALWRAIRLIRHVRPDLVVAGTPKAGLLGMLSSWLCSVRHRVYVVHGLRLETESGVRRGILAALERVAFLCSTRAIAVSPSLRDRVLSLRLVGKDKVTVLGPGSATGVDISKFHPSVAPATVPGLRSPVLAFIGRLSEDKGLILLADALRLLAKRDLAGSLLVVGGDEGPESHALRTELETTGWDVRHVGEVLDVAPYLRLTDILCLPSRREGFGTVVIEAGAMGVPTVGTEVTGLTDAVVSGVTGLLTPDADAARFAEALFNLMESRQRRRELGEAALQRVRADFSSTAVLDRWGTFFVELVHDVHKA